MPELTVNDDRIGFDVICDGPPIVCRGGTGMPGYALRPRGRPGRCGPSEPGDP
jgi:hypothetical protein